MQSVQISELDHLYGRVNHLLRQMPQKRRVFHEKCGEKLHRLVKTQIAASLQDTHGKIAGWQQRYIGSGGGYAAVRAIDSSTGANSPGAITNYLENGHAIRRPSGKYRRYKRRMRTAYVNGRHFYGATSVGAERALVTAAIDFADALAAEIRG